MIWGSNPPTKCILQAVIIERYMMLADYQCLSHNTIMAGYILLVLV